MKRLISIIFATIIVIITSYFSAFAEMIYEDYNFDFGKVRLTGFNDRQIEIAKHLINCEESFSVEYNKNIKIQDYHNDLFYANTQNPLSPFVNSFYTITNQNEITYHVKYFVNPRNAKEWIPQEYKKAKSIAYKISKKYNSRYDACRAINNYLCQNSKFDYKALKYSGVNYLTMNILSTDIQSAYAPYGVLCCGEGVCLSYAQSFHLICDMLKIPCISVRGIINGQHHIWNRVRINYKWYNIDVSENSVTGKNVMLFAPSNINKIYKEINLYWCPVELMSNYSASSINLEYYYKQGKYMQIDKICEYIDNNFFKKKKRPLRITIRIQGNNSSVSKMSKEITDRLNQFLKYKKKDADITVSGNSHGVYTIWFNYRE